MLERIASRSDCANCAALCCVAYPSDDMPGFAASKRSGEPCPRLAQCGTCTIYEDRERLGFGGCIAYECFGAGQFVTQALSHRGAQPGRTVATQAMIDRFLQVRPAFDLLHLAQRLAGDNLPPDHWRMRFSAAIRPASSMFFCLRKPPFEIFTRAEVWKIAKEI